MPKGQKHYGAKSAFKSAFQDEAADDGIKEAYADKNKKLPGWEKKRTTIFCKNIRCHVTCPFPTSGTSCKFMLPLS
jgi:hypothetical protein